MVVAGGGASGQGISPAAGIELGTYPAADTNAYLDFGFVVPRDFPSGKTWYYQFTYMAESGGDTYAMTHYVSAHKVGDAYGGWNKINGVSIGSITATSAWVRYEHEQEIGAVIDPEDVVTIRLVKTSSDTRQLDIMGIILYWK